MEPSYGLVSHPGYISASESAPRIGIGSIQAVTEDEWTNEYLCSFLFTVSSRFLRSRDFDLPVLIQFNRFVRVSAQENDLMTAATLQLKITKILKLTRHNFHVNDGPKEQGKNLQTNRKFDGQNWKEVSMYLYKSFNTRPYQKTWAKPGGVLRSTCSKWVVVTG